MTKKARSSRVPDLERYLTQANWMMNMMDLKALVLSFTHDLKPLCPICESLSLSDFFRISPVICVVKRKNRGK